MNAFQTRNRFVAAAVFFIVFLIYFKTAAPTTSFWDCGEFIATSYILGVPHPPGAPFYTLLGRTFSMLPLSGEIAFRVNLMSVFSAAATVLLIYLCVVRLLCIWLHPQNGTDQLAILTGGAVAALSTAFSTSFWSNATEAEVYGLSMCITLLAFWLALRWDDTRKDRNSDRLLILIAYLFGLGAGVHLQCLLTVPGILILLFTDLMEDRPFKDQVLMVIGLILYPFLAIVLPMALTVLMTMAILVGLAILRPAWRNPRFWVCGVLVAGLGYSTYLALFIRSGLNPLIDMNNPETWGNFKAFLAREQYGTHSTFPRRGEFWTYQLNIHIKYFLQQFPYYDTFTGAFRRAVSTYASKYETLSFSTLPLLFGIGGAVYHFRKDWKRFATVFAIFALMGLGLVLYLNMPDPEPREREYIFVGAYTFFGFWIGIGAAGLIAALGRTLASVPLAGLAACLALLLPAGILDNNRFSQDRSGNHIAHDYAYNILQSCEPNAILFTNGDNDTYPLWYLQYAKGIRTDIRVTNLSLLKTPWYIKQLRDLDPKIPIKLSDQQIHHEAIARPWRQPKAMEVAGITIKAEDIPTAQYLAGGSDRRIPVLEPQTVMIWWIVQQVNWERPIYFAVTVPGANMAGLRPNLSMEGMAYRLVKTQAPGQFDTRRTARNVLNTYRYEGVADSTVYKDPVARRLLGNYIVIFDALIRAYIREGLYTSAFQVLQQAEKRLPAHALDPPESWNLLAEHYRLLAAKFEKAGQIDSAVTCIEELLRVNPNARDREKIEQIVRTWKTRIDSTQ